MGPPKKKKKKKGTKNSVYPVPVPDDSKFSLLPSTRPERLTNYKNSGTQQLTERMPAKLTPCAEPGLVSDDMPIHHPCPPVFYPNVNRPRYMFIHVLFLSSKSTPRVQTWSQLSPRFQMLVSDWLNRISWPAAQTFKTVRRKNSISKFTNCKCKHFSSKQKGHPKETISSKR